MVIVIVIINNISSLPNFTQLRMQDVIYRIKTAFNADFEAVHRQKEQELNRVRDRNRHIRGIMLELDMNERLWEPSLTNSERPERRLTAHDSEVTDLLMKHLNSLTKFTWSSTNKAYTLNCSVLCFCFFLQSEIVCDYHHRRCFFTVHQRHMRLCPTLDKSRKVPHPRTEKGGGEEEVGSAKTFGCQGMLP